MIKSSPKHPGSVFDEEEGDSLESLQGACSEITAASCSPFSGLIDMQENEEVCRLTLSVDNISYFLTVLL